jgi:hypothetical protein
VASNTEISAMTTMIAEVYDALLAAGSPEDKARKAAEAVAGYEDRFTTIDQRLIRIEGELSQRFVKIEGELNQRFAKLEGELNQRFAKIEGELNQRFAKIEGDIKLLSWMLGFNLAATVGVFFMLLRH